MPHLHSQSRSAPFVVFGAIFGIGIVGVSVVCVSQCRREVRLMDPVIMAPGNPDRLDSPGKKAERQRMIEARKRARDYSTSRSAGED
jgi:hypothetical protein